MRLTRRGCFTGRKEPKYIWYVYNSSGGTMVGTVESNTMDYPVDGEQDGYWYVMVKGEYPMYVWNVYNISYRYGYKEASKTAVVSFTSGSSIYRASSYSFSTSSGTFTLNSPTSTRWSSSYIDILSSSGGSYWMKGSSSGSYVMNGMQTLGSLQPTLELTGTQRYAVQDTNKVISVSRGTSTGTTVESYDQSAYPQNNYQGDYWYVYSHSYNYVFDNR